MFAGHKALLTLLDVERQQQQSAGAGATSVQDSAKHTLVRFETLVLPHSSACFALAGVGHDLALWSLVLHGVVGYDTILMNHLAARFGATGVFYSEARETTTELRASSALRTSGVRASLIAQ